MREKKQNILERRKVILIRSEREKWHIGLQKGQVCAIWLVQKTFKSGHVFEKNAFM